RKLLLNPLANQNFRGTIRSCNEISVALVFDFQVLMKVLHQQRARFSRNGGHGGKKAVGDGWEVRHWDGMLASILGHGSGLGDGLRSWVLGRRISKSRVAVTRMDAFVKA